MFIPEPYAHLPFPDVIRCLYNMCDLLITGNFIKGKFDKF